MQNVAINSLGTRHRQCGAIAVLVAFSMIALVLMLGLVLDLGHLYVAKNELQNAADACALGGARELNDLGSGALDRATAAATTTGNRNRVDMQKDAVNILPADVTFSDALSGPYSRVVGSTTLYARCAPNESNPKSVVLWFMAMAGVSSWNMSAVAIARLMGGGSFCAIPLAMCTTATAGTPNLGFVTGTWYSGRLASGTAKNGNYDWIRFQGQKGKKDISDIIAGTGACEVGTDPVDVEPGVATSVAKAWNTRFGLYANPYNDIDSYPPDRTGWAYTPNTIDKKGHILPGSWPKAAPQNAYPDYLTRTTVTHDPFNPTSMLDNNGKEVNLPGNPSPLSRALHASKGQDRRMVLMPVISCNNWAPNKKGMAVLDYACALLISPIDDPGTDVQVEFRGLKSQGTCASTGVPSGSGTPVPALVK